MKPLVLFVSLCVAGGCAGNQGPRFWSRDAARGITERSVQSHLEFLAGDALNGRGSGTRDEWIAAAYIGSQMRRWGIEPLWGNEYVQEVQIERREVTSPSLLSVSGKTFTDGDGIRVMRLGGTNVSGPPQKYRPGTPVINGAALLLSESSPPPASEIAGASIVLRRAVAPASGVAPPPRPRVFIEHIIGVPERASVSLDEQAYTDLSAAPGGALVTLTTEAKPPVVAHPWNAGGRLTGREPRQAGEVILLTAHVDHLGAVEGSDKPLGGDTVYNGADDDASGSVAVLRDGRGHRETTSRKAHVRFRMVW